MASLRIVFENEQQINQPGDDWITRLYDAVTVVSYMPGRVRFHLGFGGDEILADTMRRELNKITSAKLESYSVRTRNALISYDPDVISDADVATALLKAVKEFARLHGECDLEHHHHSTGLEKNHAHNHSHEGHDHDEEEECGHDHSAASTDAGIRKELFKLAGTGAVLGYFVYRKLKKEPIVFAGNPLLDVAALLTIVSGYSIFRDGVNAVQKNKKATDDTLISIAVIATLLMGESLTGLSVVWLINLGRLLEAITLKRSRTAIKELMDISPKEAWLLKGKKNSLKVTPVRTAVESIEKGQVIRVFHSEKIPLDGKIIRGIGAVKESFITGEAIPKEKIIDDIVYAGSLLEAGEIDIEVTNLVHETVIAHMIHAIENERDNKAPIEKMGTKFASQFVPISLGVAGLTLLFTGDLRRAITMLVIACPCAAGLATPTAVSASIGQAARKGILIKGGTHIESAAKIDAIIFDKTGTLTQGSPSLTKFIESETGRSLGFEQCLLYAASAEQHTTHPLGLALVGEAKKYKMKLLNSDKYKTQLGMGISSTVDEKEIHVGNVRFFKHLNISVPSKLEKEASEGFIAGESLLYLSIDRVIQGVFLVQDQIRPEAVEMLIRLKGLGVRKILIATGDQEIAAQYIARQLGISDVHAELMPKDKLALVDSLKKQGHKVAMVGDGVNDAQALANADLSIAMGAGRCDVAIETSDVTLAKNDLLLVSDVLDISQKTLKTIRQNFIAAVGINAGGVAFGAMGKLSPFAAAIVHNASTIAVVLNSLRLGKEVGNSNPLKTIGEIKI